MLAGAALLAGAAVEKAFAQPQQGYAPGADDLALAIPRVSPRGASGVALPQPLPPSEASRLRRIFALQARGDIPAALQETASLDGSTPLGQGMLGHVLADRYLGRFTRPDAGALQDWLSRWSDLPDARAVYSLLLVRLPRGAKAPEAPGVPAEATVSRTPPVPEETEPADSLPRSPSLERAVREAARAGNHQTILKLISGAARGSPVYAAVLRGEAARVLFTLNRDQEAYDIAAGGVRICGAAPGCQEAALPAYVAGLAAWRMEQPDLAGLMFEAAWRAGITTPAQQAAAAFWAARARLRTHDYAGFRPWMNRAAGQPSTFYGQIARRSLGLPSRSRRQRRGADRGGYRCRRRHTRGSARLCAAADRPDRPRGSRVPQARVRAPGQGDASQYDVGARPDAGGRSRRDDRFRGPTRRPRAGRGRPAPRDHPLRRATAASSQRLHHRSGDGVRACAHRIQFRHLDGLVGRGPRTDADHARDGALHHRRRRGLHGAGALHDPALNLDLGQRYVAYLATHDVVGGDLIRLLASYNSGPGNFGRWSPGVHDGGDPLLFIEAIPVDETRAFVPRVLTYTWLYAARLRLPAPSLDELAAGEWPRYHPRDDADAFI